MRPIPRGWSLRLNRPSTQQNVPFPSCSSLLSPPFPLGPHLHPVTACSTRLINLFRRSFATRRGSLRLGFARAPISRSRNSTALSLADIRTCAADGYTGGCFRFRDVQYYALLADYQDKAPAKRRRDATDGILI